MNIPQVTDASLFGEAVGGPKRGRPCKPKCSRCGAPERIRSIGKLITTTLSPVLGICGRCVAIEAGL